MDIWSKLFGTYHNAKFFVPDPDPTSDSPHFTLQRGIMRYPTGLSTQSISLQYCCFRPHLRCKHLFAGYFSYTPWTYSTAHPLTDVEYADDTVLVARTQEDTLSRLFHLLQHMAAQIGLLRLLLNGSKCQLLSCVSMPLFLSLFLCADAFHHCDFPHCIPFFSAAPNPSSMDVPLAPLKSAKYLGSCITPTSSSIPDVNFRCSEASSAFKSPITFFDVLSFPKNLSSKSIHTLSIYSILYFFMAQNLKSTPKLKFLKSTLRTG